MAIRLINVETLVLESFMGDSRPRYAILSHTWEPSGEISFQEMIAINGNPNHPAARKSGYTKIVKTCQKAKIGRLKYAWVDTCCIDKSSSAELSEAINSMFRWYKEAEVCFAFLSDYDTRMVPTKALANCRWFSRGWCLQELLAPKRVLFFNATWNHFGTRDDLASDLSEFTRIDENVLLHRCPIAQIPVARRMSWAARRTTTRVEDRAYCLLGIFDINMPMLYGEGQRAFTRLQEEILKSNSDLSIFAFHPASPLSTYALGPNQDLMATSPSDFGTSANIVHTRDLSFSNDSYTMTNKGLYFPRIQLEVDFRNGLYQMALRCEADNGGRTPRVMYLLKVGPSVYARVANPGQSESRKSGYKSDTGHIHLEEDVYILRFLSVQRIQGLAAAKQHAIHISCPDYDITTALQFLPRPYTSSRWDISRMEFMTFGEENAPGFWEVYPARVRPISGRKDVYDSPFGPLHLVCGLTRRGPDVIPWLCLFLNDEWQALGRVYGSLVDANDAEIFDKTQTSTCKAFDGITVGAVAGLGPGPQAFQFSRIEVRLFFGYIR